MRRAPRVLDDRLHVVEQRRRDVDALHVGLQLHQLGARHARVERREQVAPVGSREQRALGVAVGDRKSTRLNSSHLVISYAVFCLKKKKKMNAVLYLPSYASNGLH